MATNKILLASEGLQCAVAWLYNCCAAFYRYYPRRFFVKVSLSNLPSHLLQLFHSMAVILMMILMMFRSDLRILLHDIIIITITISITIIITFWIHAHQPLPRHILQLHSDLWPAPGWERGGPAGTSLQGPEFPLFEKGGGVGARRLHFF